MKVNCTVDECVFHTKNDKCGRKEITIQWEHSRDIRFGYFVTCAEYDFVEDEKREQE